MSKEIYISSTPHETRLAIVEKDELTEIYYERENEYTLAGSIYNGRVTRVLPGMQSSFVDIGLERDAFLYITDFMEEAGDAADFEAAGDGGPRALPRERTRTIEGAPLEQAPREPREGRGRDHGRGRGEGRREGEGRKDGEGRRDGGRRGRGRRDGRRRTTDSLEPRSATGPVDAVPYSEPIEIDSEVFAARPVPVATEGFGELGFEAPVAEGARRWRGRRGRRRGRGSLVAGASETPAAGDELLMPESAVSALEMEPQFTAAPVSQPSTLQPERSRDQNREPGREGGRNRRRDRDRNRNRGPRDGQATVDVQAPPAERAPVAAQAPRPERAPREERGPREDRGARRERGRRGERGDRGPREDRAPREDLAPRETVDDRHAAIRERFAPRGNRSRGREEEVVDLTASAVEPLILPGESLSKYRKGEDASASPAQPIAAANIITPKPSTEVEPLLGWDGGAVLPGESLSRRRDSGGENRNEPRHESRGDNRNDSGGRDFEGRGSDRRRERDQRRSRNDREAAPREMQRQEFAPQPKLEPSEAVQPAVTSAHEFDSPLPIAHAAPGFEAESANDEPVTEAVPAEHEPSETAIAAALEAHEATREYIETTAEYEPGEEASASFRVDPAGAREFRQGSVIEESAEHLTEEHTFTAVQPGGEMISETHYAEPQAHEHIAPIEQEHAVHSVTLREAEHHAVPMAPEAAASPAPGNFAPGQGTLEEELLDDEDPEPLALHADATHEELDEEALEHAADLGSMIEDISLDQMTRAESPELEDEDDFEYGDDELEEDELAMSEGDEPDDEVSASEISEAEEEEFAEAASVDGEVTAAPREGQREGGRRGRRDGRRGGRDRNRGDRTERRPAELVADPIVETAAEPGAEPSTERSDRPRGDRERSGGRDRRGMANSRGYSGNGRERGRHSAQSTDLPAISDLLKPGQEVLVQIAKEPIAKKGARITSHIALPGRFLVFMPTVSHVGVSRKIESDAERRRLKEILLSERGEASGGFIVRTAAAGASEEDLRSDLRFLLNLWTDIKARSESSKSPALIYHDLNLIERILRDQVTDNFSAIWVDTEAVYERVQRFLQRFQPALVRRVKLYSKETPLFEQFGINAEIDKALRSKVWLKSGGSIVINQTEALVAIDINTGKYVGKTARLEDTIVKTNLDAIPEIVRQVRLRDLGGIIIIDFIDMDERKNRNRVMAALEEELKKDRAPSKVLQFNDFGLVAITRKRVKQSLERTLSTTCGVCQGTGMTKSPITVCNDLYIEMRKMHKSTEKGDLMLRVHPEVVKHLKLNGGKWLQEMEELSGKTILLKSDPTMHPEQFDIH